MAERIGCTAELPPCDFLQFFFDVLPLVQLEGHAGSGLRLAHAMPPSRIRYGGPKPSSRGRFSAYADICATSARMSDSTERSGVLSSARAANPVTFATARLMP